MPDDVPPLRPARRADVVQALSFVMRHGRRVSRAEQDDLIARMVADQIMDHLERSNFVVMQGPPAQALSAAFPHNPNLTK